MLEPIWLSATAAQPLVLNRDQAQAVWRALLPSDARLPDAPDGLLRARAQQLLDVLLTPRPAADGADTAGSSDAPAAVHERSPDLQAAIRVWQAHRRASALGGAEDGIDAARLGAVRLALRAGWPGTSPSMTVALATAPGALHAPASAGAQGN